MWQELGRTEAIDNNLNPKWVKIFDLDFEFHKNKQLRFEVLDEDDSGEHELIGFTETTLAEIMISPKQTFTQKLFIEGNKKPRGTLIVQADQIFDCTDEAKMAFAGKIKSTKFLGCYGTDNPYVRIERSRTLESQDLTRGEDPAVTDWVPVYQTNRLFGTSKCEWDPFTIRMSTLCNNNKKLPLRISVHNFRNYGTHYCYGSAITSIREIEMGNTTLTL